MHSQWIERKPGDEPVLGRPGLILRLEYNDRQFGIVQLMKSQRFTCNENQEQISIRIIDGALRLVALSKEPLPPEKDLQLPVPKTNLRFRIAFRDGVIGYLYGR